ncbi:TPA: hypothetical protein ACH3X1_008979 [Trebouxia sp. C0004]
MTVVELADQLHALLLPGVECSVPSCQRLADKLQQVVVHLQQNCEGIAGPAALTDAPQKDADASDNVKRLSADEPEVPVTASVQQAAVMPVSRKSKRKLAKPFLIESYQQRYVALEVFYLGWQYHGFASQCGTEGTVEGLLFNAMQKAKLIAEGATWQQVNYSRCGRTDKGVSAAGQVIALLLRSASKTGEPALLEEDEMDYSLKLNKELPADIRVLAWCTVPADFSARFSTAHREYTYYIVQHGQLDIAAMQQSAAYFVGEHDFRNFCKLDLEHVKSFRRRILDFQVKKVQPAGTDGRALYALHVKGTAFLWHQVRCMAAVLMMVGNRLEHPEVVQQLLDIEQNPCKPQYRYASETLQIIEHAADRHRIGSSIYMHLAEKLKSDTYYVHQTINNERHSHGITAALHVKILKREKEPDIAQRLRAWSEIQSAHS